MRNFPLFPAKNKTPQLQREQFSHVIMRHSNVSGASDTSEIPASSSGRRRCCWGIKAWASPAEPLHPPVLTGFTGPGLIYSPTQRQPPGGSQLSRVCLLFLTNVIGSWGRWRVFVVTWNSFVFEANREREPQGWRDEDTTNRTFHHGNPRIIILPAVRRERKQGSQQRACCARTFTHWTTFVWLISSYGDDSYSARLNFALRCVSYSWMLLLRRFTREERKKQQS